MIAGSPVVRLPALRLARDPRGWLPIASWTALAILGAILFARAHVGASHALVDVFGAFAVPLVACASIGGALGGEGLARSTRSLVAFGASPKRAALASIAVAMIVTAIVVAPLGAIVVAIAHGAYDPPVAGDAITTAGVALLGGVAYVALFAWGASFGARGEGRWFLLAADFILGVDDPLDVVTPRGHLRSLLGGDAVIDLRGAWSAIALVAIAILFTALAAGRARRPAPP